MDWRDSKTQKIVIAVLAFFIVGYFWYSRLYSRYDSQISMKSQEFETITTNLRNVEMKAKSLDALKMEYSDLMSRYYEIEALLPEVKQVPSILVQLHTAASLTGTRITKVVPKEIVPEAFYNVAGFQVELVGTYHDYGKFISYVANFPFIANISEVEIKTPEDNSGRSARTLKNENKPTQVVGKKKETMVAKFTLSTYFVKDEERLKELAL